MPFEPISIRDVTLKNRVVVAPMHQYSADKGFATDWHLMNAGRYAAGGAGIMTMAVGLIVHADQAEQILQHGRANLVALARELLCTPNWPMDAAQKLGVDRQFGSVPPA
jgi:2,4-dienoyl-CoA reductase-like NADH-dependent reductase (Old Yellow Enzyme family)